MKRIIDYITLAVIMGGLYMGIEILYDGTSHWSMIVVGGICGILIGLLNEYKLKWTDSLVKQVGLGIGIILPIEFVSGCIINLWLKLDVWDYSQLPLNLMGQTSLAFVPVFIPCVLLAIFIDDWHRHWVYGEQRPHYHLF